MTRSLCATAAFALGLVLLAPGSAKAQYTLTFDGGSGHVPSPYSGPAAVTISDGWQTGFGTTAPLSAGSNCMGSLGNGKYGLCYATGNPFGTNTGVEFRAQTSSTTSGIGEFVIDPTAGNVASFDSVRVGNLNSSGTISVELELWALTGSPSTPFATYSIPTLGTGSLSSVLVTASSFGLGSQSSLAGGFRFEWGISAAASGGDKIFIDNLTFHSEVVPEPATMLLMATGLTAVAGLARRRKTRRA